MILYKFHTFSIILTKPIQTSQITNKTKYWDIKIVRASFFLGGSGSICKVFRMVNLCVECERRREER